MIYFVADGIQSTYHLTLMYFWRRSKWSVLYHMMMGCTDIHILCWVVTPSICSPLYNPIYSVCAKSSGVTTERLEFSNTFLTVPLLCYIIDLSLPLIMRFGDVYFTFIVEINHSSDVSSTIESVINPKTRSLLWKISLGPPLLQFLDIYATHALSLYGMFLSIVTFYGYHLTSPCDKTMWAQVYN